MVKIVSRENIKLIEKSRLINDKKEIIELNKLARPEEKKKPKMKLPASRIIKQPKENKINTQEIIAMMRAQKPKYTEYKESLDKIAINLMSRTEFNETYNEGLQNKLKNSDDIKSILLDGFKSAFLPNRAKSIMLNMVNDELNKF